MSRRRRLSGEDEVAAFKAYIAAMGGEALQHLVAIRSARRANPTVFFFG